MNLYLAVIGIISTLSSILIIICINSKSEQPNEYDSNNPLKRQGFTEVKKSKILLIVCCIFFMSLITTNIKTSKFSVIFSNLLSSQDDDKTTFSKNLKEIFYGHKGKCRFTSNAQKYSNFINYLEKGQIYQKSVSKIFQKNYNFQSSKLYLENSQNSSQNSQIKPLQQLIIFKSDRPQLGDELILPKLCEKICQETSELTPILWINLQKKIDSQQQLMKLIQMQNYEELKQNVCKLNGIQIKREVQKIGNYFIQKEKYQQNLNYNKKNSFIVINNFQHILETLIFDKKMKLKQQNTFSQIQSLQQNSQKSCIQCNISPKYQLFFDKLFNQLIQKCKLNVILHSSKKQSINQLYEKWKLFSQNKKSNFLNQQLAKFPFTIQGWKGLTKIQFYQIVKQLIQNEAISKNKEQKVWRLFEKQFGSISGPSFKKIKSNGQESEEKTFIKNNQQLSLNHVQQFFRRLETFSDEKSGENTHNQKKDSQINDVNEQIAYYYGLQESFKEIKAFSVSKKQYHQNGIQIGALKQKIPLMDVIKLEQLGFLFIKQGKVYLTK